MDIDAEMADVARLIISQILLGQDITAEIDAAQKPVENNLTLVLGTIPGTPQRRRTDWLRIFGQTARDYQRRLTG